MPLLPTPGFRFRSWLRPFRRALPAQSQLVFSSGCGVRGAYKLCTRVRSERSVRDNDGSRAGRDAFPARDLTTVPLYGPSPTLAGRPCLRRSVPGG